MFSKASINISEWENKFLESWSTCAVYAGRYPIARNEHTFPNQRMPAKSREELIQRQKKKWEKAIKEDKSPLPETQDIIHTGIGTEEEKIFDTLFDKLLKEITTFSKTQGDAELSDSKESSLTHNSD